MELGWGALALIIIAAFAAWFWQDSLAARELANHAATRACEDLGLQFLDGTVAFARLVLGRSTHGTLALRRTYVFDYTANSIERRQGFVVLAGRRVESVGYAQDERPAAPQARQAEPPAPRPPVTVDGDDPRVARLDDWRARKRSGDRN